MSNFWNTSDGEDVTQTAEKEYDAGGGMEPVPDNTNCLLNIDNANWDKDKDGNKYIKVQYSVLKPESVANRKIWQKLWVKDDDPNAKDAEKKRNNALKMLAAIDAIAGGKLARAAREPDDDDLAFALTNKQLIGKAKIWEMGGSSGNWIAHVAAKNGSLAVSDDVKAAVKKVTAKLSVGDNDLDGDDIPF